MVLLGFNPKFFMPKLKRLMQQRFSPLVSTALVPPHLYTLLKQTGFKYFKFHANATVNFVSLATHRSLTNSAVTQMSYTVAALTFGRPFVVLTNSMLDF